jgi:hypothetical protein
MQREIKFMARLIAELGLDGEELAERVEARVQAEARKESKRRERRYPERKYYPALREENERRSKCGMSRERRASSAAGERLTVGNRGIRRADLRPRGYRLLGSTGAALHGSRLLTLWECIRCKRWHPQRSACGHCPNCLPKHIEKLDRESRASDQARYDAFLAGRKPTFELRQAYLQNVIMNCVSTRRV